MSNLLLNATKLLSLIISCFTLSVGIAIADVVTPIPLPYTCEEADTLKFNKSNFQKLTLEQQQFVEGVYYKCEAVKRGDDNEVVYFTNPTPVEGVSKVFYGVIKRKDLANAVKNCGGASKVIGISMQVAGAATANPGLSRSGSATYQFGSVVCKNVGGEVEKGNLVLIIAPEQTVNSIVAGTALKVAIDKIPFVSDADKRKLKQIANPTSVQITKREIVIRQGPVKVSIKKPKW